MKTTHKKICSPSFSPLEVLLKALKQERFDSNGTERYSEQEEQQLTAALKALCSNSNT